MRVLNGSGVAPSSSLRFWFAALAILASVAPPARAGCRSAGGFGGIYPISAESASGWPLAHDMNGDGRLDVVYATPASRSLRIVAGSLPLPHQQRWSPVRARTLVMPTPQFVPGPSVARDFNSDGVADLAICATEGASFGIALGARADTSWSYVEAHAYALPGDMLAGRRQIAVADLNEDGILDVVVGGTRGVSIWTGQGSAGVGSGSFVLACDDTTLVTESGLAVADFDGDGHLDVALTTSSRPVVTICRGLGNGALGAKSDVATSGVATALACPDLNADGRGDFVLGHVWGVGVFVNTTTAGGAFTFQWRPLPTGPTIPATAQVSAMDVDLDGVLDVQALSGSGRITHYWGSRSGSTYSLVSVSQTYIPQQASGIAYGDLDDDGMLDYVTTNGTSLNYGFGVCSGGPDAQLRLSRVVHGAGRLEASPPGPDYPSATTVQLTATPDPGQLFSGWTGLATGADNPTSVNVVVNQAAHAWFTPVRHRVDTSVEGHGVVVRSNSLAWVPEGASVLLTAVADSGSHFLSWTGAYAGTANPLNISPSLDGQVIARFERDPVPLTTFTNPASAGRVDRAPNATKYVPGTPVTLTAVPFDGWRFAGWNGALIGTANPDVVSFDEADTVTANFVLQTHPVSVTIVGDGGVTLLPSASSYTHGTIVTFMAYPAGTAVFGGWSGDTTMSYSQFWMRITRPIALTARFDPHPALFPRLLSILDVPGDEGGKLGVRWLRTMLDVTPELTGRDVSEYVVFRSLPGETGFDSVGVTPAVMQEIYASEVTTTADSTATAHPHTRVFVRAYSLDRSHWWDSAVDSACSVDNLPPPPPTDLRATHSASGLRLEWTASAATDISSYRMYWGSFEDFYPDPSTRLRETSETALDLPWNAGPTTYVKLTAVDVHGNEGAPATLGPEALDAVAGPVRFALAPPRPNPVRGELIADFSLDRAGEAVLEAIDVSGRVMARRTVSTEGAGAHRVVLAPARALPAGLYFLRLTQGERSTQRRIAIVW